MPSKTELTLIAGQTAQVDGVSLELVNVGRHSQGNRSAGCVTLVVSSTQAPVITKPGDFDRHPMHTLEAPKEEPAVGLDILETAEPAKASGDE